MVSGNEPAAGRAWSEQLGDVSERLAQPAESVRKLLADVVARATVAVGAANGAVLAPEPDGQHLRFITADGNIVKKLMGLTVPITGSIAGYVFSTGEMMAVGDLTEEKPAAFYAEIDRKTGIATRTYLALPMMHAGRTEGVLTFVNRPGQPPYRPFEPHEMDIARTFAAAEAVLLRHLRRTLELERVTRSDWAAAPSEVDVTAGSFAALDVAPAVSPWAEVIELLENLPGEDLAFCTELLALVARWRNGR
jgi:GAF domain-containing protein